MVCAYMLRGKCRIPYFDGTLSEGNFNFVPNTIKLKVMMAGKEDVQFSMVSKPLICNICYCSQIKVKTLLALKQ